MKQDSTIHDVSDTALWVAHYRTLESERLDSLFRDPLAKKLVGERGKNIAESMGKTGQYTQWTIVTRTCIIDGYIKNFLNEGIDTIVNLGAGLDTRPYRMQLPNSLRWVEVDYPHLIEYKDKLLADDKPNCRLERVGIDLADREKRTAFFSKVAKESKKALILTEGVLPYLTPTQVGELADDLHKHESFQYWIAEYFSQKVYKYLSVQRMKKMKNAPFLFFPDDWFAFFKKHKWVQREIKYTGEESVRMKRKIPMPWFAHFLMLFTSNEKAKQFQRFTGFVVFKKE